MARSFLVIVGVGLVSLGCGFLGCAGSVDAAPGADASVSADGSPPVDSSPSTTQPISPSSSVACTDALADVYKTPSGLGALADAARGDIVRCAPDTTIDEAALNSRLRTTQEDVEVITGATTFRILYRTRKSDGSPAVSSARVFLPKVRRAGLLPAVVAAHGTIGVADICAPSMYETVNDYLALPFVTHGYPVIAPDYAGLGTDGIQGYGDNIDTGQSTLDAARALRKLVGDSAVGDRALVFGHSQGGGAALSAQALAPSYGAGLTLMGVVAFAPGLATQVNTDGYAYPAFLTSYGFGGPASFTALMLYSYFGNRYGDEHRGDGFGASVRSQLTSLVDTQCILQLPTTIPIVAPTYGVLMDETFRTTVLACGSGTGTCAEPGKSFVSYLHSNIPTFAKGGAPVLAIQGMADTVVTPSSFRCIVDKLRAEGATLTVCTDDAATHTNVVSRSMKHTLAWVDAVVDGGAPPSCTEATLPACP